MIRNPPGSDASARFVAADTAEPSDFGRDTRLHPCRPGAHAPTTGTLEGVDSEGGWLDDLVEAAAAHWRRVLAQVRDFEEADARRNLQLDSLLFDEVRRQTVGALDHAVRILRETPLDAELRRHGWSERFAHALVDGCVNLREAVENGTYEKERGGAGLGRQLLDEISGMQGDEDDLHDAVHEAQFMLQAFSRRLPVE